MSRYSGFKGEGNVHTNGNPDSIPIMVNWNRSDYHKILALLEPLIGRGNRTAIREAINRSALEAAKTGKAETKKLLAEDTTLKAAEIGKRIKVYKHGSALDMAIGMKISDTARPISDYAFTPSAPKYRTAPTAEVYRGQPYTLVKGAFVAKMPETGHIGIYEREKDKLGKEVVRKDYTASGSYDMETQEHIHINSLPAPSVTGLFKGNEQVHNMVWDKVFSTFQKRVMHNVNFLLGGASG